jgi:hypothetical protein
MRILKYLGEPYVLKGDILFHMNSIFLLDAMVFLQGSKIDFLMTHPSIVLTVRTLPQVWSLILHNYLYITFLPMAKCNNGILFGYESLILVDFRVKTH